jgi:hypothetical protein
MLFILAVSAYDLWFALQFMHSFTTWEVNPIAISVYKLAGPVGVCLFKIITTWFFFVVTCVAFVQGKIISLIAAGLVGLVYGLLAAYYVYIWSVL